MSQVVDRVMERLVIIAKWWDATPTAEDLAHIREGVERHRKDGWTENDLVKFYKNCEEINPVISEEYACKQMGEISAKYIK